MIVSKFFLRPDGMVRLVQQDDQTGLRLLPVVLPPAVAARCAADPVADPIETVLHLIGHELMRSA